ncbi:MAG: F0F1 ATP synthase subunit A [Chloroflexales bacterium]|nr:F0F1 ATP synthase subunit A [Chloroflexales bacterium]
MRNRLLLIFGAIAVVGVILYVLGIRMAPEDLHISVRGEPLACIGGVLEGDVCTAGTILPVTNSLIMTVLIDLILVGLIVAGVGRMQMVPRGLQNVIEAVVEAFYNFARGIDAKNVGKFFPLPATIFIFFLVANMLALVPGVGSIGPCQTITHTEATNAAEAPNAEGTAVDDAAATTPAEQPRPSFFAGFPGHCAGEDAEGHELLIVPFLRAPAADLNVTLAFSLVAMFMIEFFGFQALGLGYLTKFFNFREGFIGFFVGIIELISEVGRLISFAFRIFGNIFGGEVILVVMAYLFPYLLPLPFYGFEVFVAFMQAIIFAILTLIFSATAVQAHGHDDHGTPEPIEAADAVARPAH